MSTQISSNNSPSPSPFSLGYSSIPPGACPSGSFPCPNPSLDPKNPEVWDYGFARAITFLQSPALGAGILAITFFFFIAFFSNGLLERVTPMTLGIVVTLGTLGLLALIVLILFLL
ncbi:hypothetical protein [Desulfosporosinus sp. BICA1-9]|uniref:hypothetical protein n=1 Tax=Desulfosporosinus sp. BICA1-9 TaxID=1531958 RepID=UPI000A5FC446|nr:hypothetical protein [Desulfosporosinus sp. BICA1-9]